MGKIARWRGPQPKAAARIAFPRESLRAVRRPREAGSRLRQALDRPHCLSGSQRGARAKPCQGAQSCGRARIRTNERISGVCSGFVRKPGPRLFLGLLLSFRSASDSWDYRTSTLGAASLSQQWYIRPICRDDHATKGWALTCPNGRVPKWENAKGDRAKAAPYLLPLLWRLPRRACGFLGAPAATEAPPGANFFAWLYDRDAGYGSTPGPPWAGRRAPGAASATWTYRPNPSRQIQRPWLAAELPAQSLGP